MPSYKNSRGLWLLLLAGTVPLAGCNTVLMSPSGDVAVQQGRLVVVATLLMLLIIVPVIVLTLLFAWRYRQSNAAAPYAPNWDHSIQLELVIWAAPLVIVIALGAVTWISTHTLDPYRALSRIDADRPIPAGVKPLIVQVVALDWKWLFFYPDQGVAVVNELVAPVDVPIEFRITSSSVMNSLFIPALSGQVFAMPGMETKLHAVINRAGVYDGFSSNYSGAGFTDMRFKFHGVGAADFDRWVQQVKAGSNTLSREAYLQLERPSEREPVRRYGTVAEGLYDAVVDRCVERGTMCMRQRMAIDARGGLGLAGIRNLTAPDPAAPGRLAVAALCTPENPRGTTLSLAGRD